jgi:hypothetical protein
VAAGVLVIVNQSFFQSHRSIEAVSDQRQSYQMVRIAMDRMVKDLCCAYIPHTEGSGRTLDEDGLSLYRFTGRDDRDGDVDLDSIVFTTTADLGLPGRMGGLSEVGYRLEEMENTPGRYLLIRSEDYLPHIGESKSARKMEVAENIVSMNIEYLDEHEEEHDEWELEQKLALPGQVRITLTFDCGRELLSFTGVARPPLAGQKITLSISEGEKP